MRTTAKSARLQAAATPEAGEERGKGLKLSLSPLEALDGLLGRC